MGIARTPCDEGCMLAGSCEKPATVTGRWVLAATILGSSMAFIDGTVVNVALPALKAIRPGCDDCSRFSGSS